jgi:hypothetical protein
VPPRPRHGRPFRRPRSSVPTPLPSGLQEPVG